MDTSQEFIQAVKNGELAAVEQMLNQDPGLVDTRTEQGLSIVLLAMYISQPAIADLLVSRGATLDVFTASATGRLERLLELLAAEPELANAYAEDGFQPLGLAAFFGQAPVARFLLANGSQVNSPSRNAQRVMPLHSAVAGEHFEIARDLLAAGAAVQDTAQVNAKQAGDFTPLHAAAQNGQMEMVELLLMYGADPSARSQDGRTPADLAWEKGRLEIVELLKSKE